MSSGVFPFLSLNKIFKFGSENTTSYNGTIFLSGYNIPYAEKRRFNGDSLVFISVDDKLSPLSSNVLHKFNVISKSVFLLSKDILLNKK